MTATADRLAAVGALRSRRSGTQVLYAAYVGVVVAALVGAPVVIGLVSTLADPPALDVLRAPASALVVTATCGVVLAAAVAAGATRGPVLLTPVRALLTGTDLPRRRTLRGALLAPVALLVAAAAAVAAVLTGALVAAGAATLVGAAGFVVASAAFAVVSGTVWLAGQVLAGDHPGAVALIAAAVVAATAATTALPALGVLVPWGWVGAAWPGGGAPPWWPVVALCLAASVAVTAAPALLERLHLRVLLEHSGRWQAARTAASTADVATALATFRAPPRRGRRLRAVVAAPAPVRYAVRDLVGAWRTPARAAVASAALVAGGAAVALATALADRASSTTAGPAAASPSAWALAAIGAVVGFAALGALSDGFRHAAASAGTPRLDGHGTAHLYALHAAAPLAWAVACTGAGASIAVLAGAPGVPAVTAVVATVLIATLLVTVRAYDSARGPLPLVLLAPVPSPAGDLSGLGAALWQVDAVLVSVVVAVLVVAATTAGGPVAGAATSAVVVAALVAMTASRIRRA